MLVENFLALQNLYNLLGWQQYDLIHDLNCDDSMISEHFWQQTLETMNPVFLTSFDFLYQVFELLSEKAVIVCKFSVSLQIEHLTMSVYQIIVIV